MSAVFATIQALLADTGIKTTTQGRIGPMKGSPVYPDIIVYKIAANPTQGLFKRAGLTEVRVTVESRAQSYTVSSDLGDAVEKRLSDLRGRFADTECRWMKTGNDLDDFTDDASVFRRLADYYCWVVG